MYYNTTRGSYMSSRNTMKRETPGSTDGKLLVVLGSQQLLAKYYVLKTDYDNYATVWMCRTKPAGEGDIEVAVVLSRQRTLSEPLLTEANAALPPGLTYRDANQSDCPEHDHEGHEHHQ
ncbi:lazarillo protein-like [Bacillus rossius redtenbacheri]|uniref:lazarillo protein-like n=1 Tax=Bacillus rossius redtenbacheri TaxID=93214 RepID=UPI002FDE8B40